MTRTTTMLLGIFALAISVLAVPAVARAAPTGSVDSANRVIFNSGSLTGVFEGNVPHITFYATNELGRTTYQLNFRSLIEFSTSSGVSTYESLGWLQWPTSTRPPGPPATSTQSRTKPPAQRLEWV